MTGLAAALARWLPERRWFAGKHRAIAEVVVLSAVEVVAEEGRGGPRGRVLVTEVRFADGGPCQHYQIPLGLRRTLPPWLATRPIGRVGGLTVYEATDDPELMAALLRLIADGAEVRGQGGAVRFRAARPAALTWAARAGLRVRAQPGEQSNTSVVFGDRLILKLFRRIRPGTNPDLEVHRRLGGDPGGHLAQLVGCVEADTPVGPVTLGLLQSFAAGAVDGWKLATGPAAGGRADGRLGPAELTALGRAVREVHEALARSFGTAALTSGGLAGIRAGMLARLADAVDEAPVLAPYAPLLRARFAALDTVPPGERLQRVHGDLHLGQVLRSGDRWLVIDFEGEPSAPIEDRVAPRSPLQDVAGMLRSLDYAQGHAALSAGGLDGTDAGPGARAAGWAGRAKAAFSRGYGSVTGARSALLDAYQLDKAVYEVVYETRNRPEWTDVPLRAVRELTASSPPATRRTP